jgi:hypothetical protein
MFMNYGWIEWDADELNRSFCPKQEKKTIKYLRDDDYPQSVLE